MGIEIMHLGWVPPSLGHPHLTEKRRSGRHQWYGVCYARAGALCGVPCVRCSDDANGRALLLHCLWMDVVTVRAIRVIHPIGLAFQGLAILTTCNNSSCLVVLDVIPLSCLFRLHDSLFLGSCVDASDA